MTTENSVLDYEKAQSIFKCSWGSEQFYKRSFCNNLLYTEGVMTIQKELNACWLVDLVISYMPKIEQTFIDTEDTMYFVEIGVNNNHSGYFEIFREGYDENDNYDEHITVVRQEIGYIDLPTKENEVAIYGLLIELATVEPNVFMLLQYSEH